MGKLLGNKCNNHVSRLELGKQRPSLETVLIYQILFDIKPADLVPKLHSQIVKHIAERVRAQPYLFKDKNSLLEIQERLKKFNLSEK